MLRIMSWVMVPLTERPIRMSASTTTSAKLRRPSSA
jgi:hypothetical protein